MNKRQKLVQQRFLDNEDKIIAELKKTYKQSQRDIELKTYALQSRINDLQARIDAESDEERKKVLKSMQQAKIYQKNYQDALKKQIDGILDNMQVEEFKSISDYLNKCYEDGFLGTMYDLHGQDIPLIFPIDQEAMVRAVQLDSKISEGLYKRLGEDVEQLKKDIASEVSRGISTGASFEQIGQQIGFKMMGKYDAPGGALAKAMTIARTEGHRIQVQSTMDACYKAKEIGADVVKQWDSTLDGKTRGAHKKVDGEVRELDEPFSNGLMYPGDPNGGAGEVVNCRCALLQRARWAMGEDELETLKKRAEYYGLDKSDTFDDFKKKYMKAAEEIKTNVSTKTLSNYENSIEWAHEDLASNFELYRGLPEKYHAPFDTFEAETPKYEKQLAEAFKKFDFATNTDSKAIEQILKDGKLKGIVETGTSNGENDVRLRKRATEELFNFFEVDDLEPAEFEKYGYLGTADRAKMYGDCRIVFKKDNLWDRTTFTVGDSLEAVVNGGYKTPSKVSDPKIVSFSKDPFTPDMPTVNETAIKNIQKAFDSIEENGYFKGVINNQDYVELQFHGDVTLADIDHIEIPQGSKNLAEILETAEKKGVKIKVKRG